MSHDEEWRHWQLQRQWNEAQRKFNRYQVIVNFMVITLIVLLWLYILWRTK